MAGVTRTERLGALRMLALLAVAGLIIRAVALSVSVLLAAFVSR